MREEMKFAALLAKVRYTSETLPAGEILQWATRNGAQAAGLNAGVIREGALADAVLLCLETNALFPISISRATGSIRPILELCTACCATASSLCKTALSKTPTRRSPESAKV